MIHFFLKDRMVAGFCIDLIGIVLNFK